MKKLVNRDFRIWSYTVSHNFLIVRSPMKFPDQDDYKEEENYNIDIEFTAVAYLDLPYRMNGISIRTLTENIPRKFQGFGGYKVFEIESGDNLYYIVAESYRIGTSRWVLEDRIHNIALEYDEILATS